jgi:hypothetical protein
LLALQCNSKRFKRRVLEQVYSDGSAGVFAICSS